ncbi:MAG: GHKL domain-containing protein [Lachnospiraceae bacterium]|jgi:hypothetical protein|nr:GHKL domain-containing protein [Lachnospiraceae bacterium]
MTELDQYYEIADNIYLFTTILLTAYCYAYLVKPFLSDKSSCRLQKMRIWLIAATYVFIMLFLHYMPYYINVILAYAIGIFGTFLVMCLLDHVYIRQKLFLSVIFFSLRWQAWRIVGQLLFAWSPLKYRLLSDKNKTAWFWSFVIENIRDSLSGFFLMYIGVQLLLRVYGKKQEHMKPQEFLILTIPSLSGVCAYLMIFFYYNVYTRALEQEPLSVKIGYEMLILLYSIICYATNLAIIWLFRQWKKEHEEDKRREVFSKQIQDLQSHITETEKLYKDMQNLRHDMGNHLMTLKQLYTKGEYAEAEKYADSLTCEMQKTASVTQSGNPVTDVILSERKKEMDEKEIDFSCDFHYPADGEINAFDISIILNNGLSNAIESIERECHCSPHIFLCSYRMKNMFVVEIANSFTGKLVTDDQSGLPITTKNGEGHGFGLSSIRHTAWKYLGDIEIVQEIYKQERCCVLRVMLQTM